MNRIPVDLKKIQQSLSDAARIGSREIKRNVDLAKQQIEKMRFIQRRKELFAELGRTLYEARRDGLPEAVATYLGQTEFNEILAEIENVDEELEKRQG